MTNTLIAGLEHLFQIQGKSDERWYDKDRFIADPVYRMDIIKEHLLGIYDQCTKLGNSLGWKRHTIDSVSPDYNSKEQIIDIFKWSVSLSILMEFSPQEFMDMFISKTMELDDRWLKQERSFTDMTNTLVWDIDGVFADYSSGYEEFLNSAGYKRVDTEERTSYSFFKSHGITRQMEEELHSRFINEGGFAHLPVIQEYVDALHYIKRHHPTLKNVAITARPSWIYKRLIGDTMLWMENNGIPIDMIFWDKDKSDAVTQNIFPANIIYFIEDRDKHAIELSHIGVDVLLVNMPYNQSISNSKHITRIFSARELTDLVDAKMNQ